MQVVSVQMLITAVVLCAVAASATCKSRLQFKRKTHGVIATELMDKLWTDFMDYESSLCNSFQSHYLI